MKGSSVTEIERECYDIRLINPTEIIAPFRSMRHKPPCRTDDSDVVFFSIQSGNYTSYRFPSYCPGPRWPVRNGLLFSSAKPFENPLFWTPKLVTLGRAAEPAGHDECEHLMLKKQASSPDASFGPPKVVQFSQRECR